MGFFKDALESQTPSQRLMQFEEALRRYRTQAGWNNVYNSAAGLAMTGLGLGAGYRGLRELFDITHSPPTQKYSTGPVVVDLPEVKKKREKQAAKTEAAAPAPLTAAQQASAAQHIEPRSAFALPGALPLLATSLIAPMFGGYYLTNSMFGSAAKSQRKAQIDAARKKYEQTMAQNYGIDIPDSAAPDGTEEEFSKTAEAYPDVDGGTAERIDGLIQSLFDNLEKRASSMEKSARTPGQVDWTDFFWDTIGAAGNVGLGLGLASAVVPFGVGYHMSSKRTNRAILEKALKQRQAMEYKNQPAEIYARIPEDDPPPDVFS